MSERRRSKTAADGPRFLADVRRGGGDYTSAPWRALQDEPEPVCDEWLRSRSADAAAVHKAFTMRRAAEHAISIVLRDGPLDSRTAKRRVVAALRCDERTVERAAAAHAGLVRKRGQAGATTWSLNSDSTTRSSGETLSTSALRRLVVTRIQGERQSPVADLREIAAELVADEWTWLMNAAQVYEHAGASVNTGPPRDVDWRPADGRGRDAQRETWRQGPGWRLTAAPPDD